MRLREKQENPWLKSRIVIKITSKKFGDKYYKQKAEVLEVIYKFKALVKLIQDGSKITVDQNEIETVIPAVGRQVLILQGRFRGKTAILESLEMDKFSANLKLCDSKEKIVSLPYEQFSTTTSAVC